MTDTATPQAINDESEKNESQAIESEMTFAIIQEESIEVENEYFVLGYN